LQIAEVSTLALRPFHFVLSGSEELILIGHIGTAEALRDGKDAATTEDLRTAMIHCRYL
jgi:hypothetical protein